MDQILKSKKLFLHNVKSYTYIVTIIIEFF